MSADQTRMLANARLATFMVGASRRIEAANSAAQYLGFSVGLSFRALPFEPEDQDRFVSAWCRVCRNAQAGPVILRLRQFGQLRLHTICLTRCGELVAVHLSQCAWPEGLRGFLIGTFGLTQSEVGIVEALCIGLSVKDMMARRKCSLATMRSHISAILAKTDTRSQSDLVSLVHCVSTMFSGVGLAAPQAIRQDFSQGDSHAQRSLQLSPA